MGDEEDEMEGVDSLMVRSADRLEEVQVKVGDEVVVRDHGAAVVVGIGCCGWKGKMEVQYEDGTKFHCGPGQIVAKTERRVCEEYSEVHKFGELPEESRGGVRLDEFGLWTLGVIRSTHLARKILWPLLMTAF